MIIFMDFYGSLFYEDWNFNIIFCYKIVNECNNGLVILVL